MASLLLVTGPPGAGKSTVAARLASRFDRSVLVTGDQFFAFLAAGAVEPWLPDAKEQNEVVTRAAALATGEYVRGGFTTVYDGVVGPWFLPTFAGATGLPHLHYVVLMPSVERCVDRVTTRTGHGFSDVAATCKMHSEFVGGEVDDRHVLVDPPDNVDGVVQLIMSAMSDGRLRYDIPSQEAAKRGISRK